MLKHKSHLFYMLFFFGSCFLRYQVSCGKLNLFITQENLKRDLDLDFGSHIYLVKDGMTSSVFAHPGAFHGLVAPLPASIKKLQFHWNVQPLYEGVPYVISTSSSNEDIMANPNISISHTGNVNWYENKESGFDVFFPCSGKLSGVVDLGLSLNYTSHGQNKSLNVVVRRQCFRQDSIHSINRETYTTKNPKKMTQKSLSKSLVIGLAVSFLFACTVIGACLLYYYFHTRNKKLQMKFDEDYELKNDQKVGFVRRSGKCVVDLNEHEDLFPSVPDKPIFVPKLKQNHHGKLKKGKRRRYNETRSSNSIVTPFLTVHSLEQIPEEDHQENDFGDEEEESCSDHFSETDTDEDIFKVEPSKSSKILQVENEHCKAKMRDALKYATHSYSVKGTSSQAETFVNCRKGSYKSIFKSKKKKLLVAENEDNEGYQPSPVHTPTSTPTFSSKVFDLNEARCDDSSAYSDEYFTFLNDKLSTKFNNYLVPEAQVILDKHPVNKGAFGRVYRGKVKDLFKEHGSKMTSVAVKVMTRPTDIESVNVTLADATMMTKFQHKNIMNLLGVVLKQSEAPLLIIPLLKYTDLNRFLRYRGTSTSPRHQMLSVRKLLNFAFQIADGMNYLHSVGYVHRDLASRNCMLSEDFNVKITEFGLARDISVEPYRMKKKTRLSIKWMALESFSNFTFTEKTDVWSFGVVFWEIMSFGKLPYSELENRDMEEFLTNGHRLPRPPNCSDEIYDLISSCWLKEPSDRPNFSSIYNALTKYDNKNKNFLSLFPSKVNT